MPPHPVPVQTDPAVGSPAPRSLTRSIGVGGGTLLTLSCVTPASSLFVLVPPLFGSLGTGTALAIGLAVLLCVGIAFCYSELGTLVPSSGGEYAMVSTVVSRFAGWITFMLSFIVILVVPPIIALGVAGYLAVLGHVDPSVAGALVMLAATGMGLVNLRSNAWLTGIFLVIEILAIVVVSVLGFAHTDRPAAVLGRPSMDGVHPIALVSVVAGLAVALFVVQGFSTAVYLAEEMREPHKTVSRTVFWTLGISAVVILVPVVAITLGVPDLAILQNLDLTALVVSWSSSAFGTVVSLCIAAAIVNAVIVMVIQNSRVLYASGRDRAWPEPVNRALSVVSPRFGAPWVATLVVGVSEAVLCFVPVETLSGVTGVAVVALYLAISVSVLWARRPAHRRPQVWRMPGWPVVPVAAVLALGYVLVSQSLLDLAITAGVLVVSAGYWWGYLRRRPDRWLVTIPSPVPG
ncbi:APC family permease [Amycolatopsis rubida]|uniref:Amino acid/polyamine/organocation transporter, APC superfamily n=1 Tax=Amycolatopsis rubida TaxID=112413 RepID=A0A1I5IB33_9PSEU|nr:APC family permease [Amycolatopsis rubida]SFO57772.1 amino acid/polyamine/organocation transporter, APC superfamily [Amycolatopsis rubida]